MAAPNPLPAGPATPPGDESPLTWLPDGSVCMTPGERVGAEFHRRARQDEAQNRRNRQQVESLLGELLAGDGIAPFNPADRSGPHHCFRLRGEVLEVRTHAAFMAGDASGFQLYLCGSGLMARRDGAWVEAPEAGFLAALDAACRSGARSFVR